MPRSGPVAGPTPPPAEPGTDAAPWGERRVNEVSVANHPENIWTSRRSQWTADTRPSPPAPTPRARDGYRPMFSWGVDPKDGRQDEIGRGGAPRALPGPTEPVPPATGPVIDVHPDDVQEVVPADEPVAPEAVAATEGAVVPEPEVVTPDEVIPAPDPVVEHEDEAPAVVEPELVAPEAEVVEELEPGPPVADDPDETRASARPAADDPDETRVSARPEVPDVGEDGPRPWADMPVDAAAMAAAEAPVEERKPPKSQGLPRRVRRPRPPKPPRHGRSWAQEAGKVVGVIVLGIAVGALLGVVVSLVL